MEPDTRERKELLTRIRQLIPQPIPIWFWAFFHAVPLKNLAFLVQVSENLGMMEYLFESPHVAADIETAIKRWSQRFREKSEGVTSSTISSTPATPTVLISQPITPLTETSLSGTPLTETRSAPTTPSPLGRKRGSIKRKRQVEVSAQAPLQRSELAKSLVKQRDGNRCVVTGVRLFDVAHIFPFSMLEKWEELHQFWAVLRLFWPREQIDAWKASILGNQQELKDMPHNMICLNPLLHRAWGEGALAFKPLTLSTDEKTLQVEVHLLNHRTESSRMINVDADPPKKAEYMQEKFELMIFLRTKEMLRSGHVIELTTSDPKAIPLPSLELLELQWILNNVLALCAAAEPQGHDLESDDDEAPELRDDISSSLEHELETPLKALPLPIREGSTKTSNGPSIQQPEGHVLGEV